LECVQFAQDGSSGELLWTRK